MGNENASVTGLLSEQSAVRTVNLDDVRLTYAVDGAMGLNPRVFSPAELPDEMAISAVTLAELSAGPHEVRRNDGQNSYDELAERARRLEILQRAKSEFDPVPFDAEAARIFGRVTAAVVAAGRKPRGRLADLMIAATAIGEGLPLYTTNPVTMGHAHSAVRGSHHL
jgi:hypothetical protein